MGVEQRPDQHQHRPAPNEPSPEAGKPSPGLPGSQPDQQPHRRGGITRPQSEGESPFNNRYAEENQISAGKIECERVDEKSSPEGNLPPLASGINMLEILKNLPPLEEVVRNLTPKEKHRLCPWTDSPSDEELAEEIRKRRGKVYQDLQEKGLDKNGQ